MNEHDRRVALKIIETLKQALDMSDFDRARLGLYPESIELLLTRLEELVKKEG